MAGLRQRWPFAPTWREPSGPGEGIDAILSWIRTIALPDDVVHLDSVKSPRAWHGVGRSWLGHPRGYVRFEAPSRPGARPVPVADADALSRVRFIVRPGRRLAPGPPRAIEPGWRTILDLRDVVVLERDAPHGGQRPLRLGLNSEEAWAVLRQARRSAERGLGVGGDGAPWRGPGELPRLGQRASVAVAVWTRGRLRGSVVLSPGPALLTAGRAAVLACQDARFARPTAADLAESVFQVGFLHLPRVPLSRQEVEVGDAYADKALFVSDGTRSGMYLPEVFNVFRTPIRRMQPLLQRLAREKAGLEALGPSARVEVCAMTDFVESADRSRAVVLEGPVARLDAAPVRDHAARAGAAACAWLRAIQREDGSLPLFVRPSQGADHGSDVVRTAMTAEAWAAFGAAYGLPDAVEAARCTLAWVDRSAASFRSRREVALPTAIYRGKAALVLGDESAVETAVQAVTGALNGPDPGPLVLAHAASFLDRAATRHPDAARRTDALRRDLAERFQRALAADGGHGRAAGDPGARSPRAAATAMSLAEWAELGAAFPPSSNVSREVCEWLRSGQLESGAFPDTTASDFAYSRGTGKVFEVLASYPDESPAVLDRALAWLLSMQYRPDSAFFVPHEHWPRVLGALRHDAFAQDAWIDAAGHLLLGLARLRRP